MRKIRKTTGSRAPESGPARGAALYRKVAGALRREILRGDHPVGASLPPESELCRRFAVSRHTVRQALRQLRDDGLVASRQGAGTTVLQPAGRSGYVQTFASIEELIPYAAENRYEVGAIERVRCDTALARRLGCARGERWLRISGFRYAPGEVHPVCWTEVYVRPRFSGVSRMLARGKGARNAIYAWIEEACGERFAEVRQTLRVRPMPAAQAPAFDLQAGAPAVEVCRAYRLTSGTVAEVAFNLHPAERFSYSMTLRHRPAT